MKEPQTDSSPQKKILSKSPDLLGLYWDTFYIQYICVHVYALFIYVLCTLCRIYLLDFSFSASFPFLLII